MGVTTDCQSPEWLSIERAGLGTHRVDAGQLLGELQDDSDQQRLAVERRAEQLRNGHLLLPHHLPALLLHFLHVSAHVCGPSQLLQHWKVQRKITSWGDFCRFVNSTSLQTQTCRVRVCLRDNLPLLALFSSFLLMRRKRGLSGQRGSRMHCSTAGMKMKLNSSGHRSALPMMGSIPNT